jgi:1-acyl-sn-glycerol-3-phosphate acyltransferase
MPVMIFPEGTRSKTGEMGSFKDGAFRLAIETGATIVPLAVTGTETALPKADWRFGEARATVQIGEFIPTSEYAMDDLEQLKTFTRNRIQSMRDAAVSD